MGLFMPLMPSLDRVMEKRITKFSYSLRIYNLNSHENPNK
jgi:hypothetical protein